MVLRCDIWVISCSEKYRFVLELLLVVCLGRGLLFDVFLVHFTFFFSVFLVLVFGYLRECLYPFSVVNQFYTAEILKEYVIRGNTGILKCNIPSFVADYVSVEGWLVDDTVEIGPTKDDYGNAIITEVVLTLFAYFAGLNLSFWNRIWRCS